mmetsp:Transcript_19669/g.41461  ORF Transcript_19669/g.41461 Transcript_19669/m.41461 type:complete len:674 (+) Transcript_19669:141-2162(+)
MSGRGASSVRDGNSSGGGGGRGRGRGRGSRGGRGNRKRGASASSSSNRPRPKPAAEKAEPEPASDEAAEPISTEDATTAPVASANHTVMIRGVAVPASGFEIPASGFMPVLSQMPQQYQSQPKQQPKKQQTQKKPSSTAPPAPAAAAATQSKKPEARQPKPKKSEPKKPEAKKTEATNSETKKLAHITDDKFADLTISSESRRALSQVFRYENMTTVQSETLPLILTENHKDCLAKAKTGTGKTLAFMIPTVEKIMATMAHGKRRRSDVHCLVISPTRELAQQIGTETEKLLTYHKDYLRKVVTMVGGTSKNRDVKALRGTTPIVVATPGRLLDHLQNSDLAQRMANLDSLIFDEADQLLDMGFRPDILRILKLLEPSKTTRQTLLFSATIPNQVEEIAKIAMRPHYNFVDTVGQDEEQTHLHVQQQLMISSQETLVRDLFSILERETSERTHKIIVFFTTARLTGFMSEMFNSVATKTGYRVLEIHSRKSQQQRERSSQQFRKSANAVLFSSDVTARGMDYPDVTYVLQVGLTERAQYIHRLGRTARAGKDGKGGLLLADYEEHHMTKRELADMPLEAMPVPESERAREAAAMAVRNVAENGRLSTSAEQAYRAWLGYYNSHLKKIRWDKKRLVQQANMWGDEVGLKDQPSLQKRTIGKMGLKGVPGLKIEN